VLAPSSPSSEKFLWGLYAPFDLVVNDYIDIRVMPQYSQKPEEPQ